MTRNSGFSQGASDMSASKKGAQALDLMRPGNGTPWEDRGSIGMFPAYLKTVWKSLTAPGLLLDHISRPETTSDSRAFAMISTAMWVVGILIWNGIWLQFILPHHPEYEPTYDPMMYWLTALLQGGLVAAFIYLWVTFGSRMYLAFGATELKGVSPTLIVNCFNYTLGPSLLAVVPVFGWAMAAVWIVVDLIVAGKRRLYMRSGSAIINAILISLCAAGIGVVSYFVLRWVWMSYLEMGGLHLIVAKPKSASPYTPSPAQ